MERVGEKRVRVRGSDGGEVEWSAKGARLASTLADWMDSTDDGASFPAATISAAALRTLAAACEHAAAGGGGGGPLAASSLELLAAVIAGAHFLDAPPAVRAGRA